MSIRNSILILILFFFVANCIQNKDDIFYSAPEANAKVFKTYAIKDISCGKSHVVTTVLVGRVKVSALEGCIRAIELTPCSQWQTNDPTPTRCKAINYIL